jgi:hypothetical protein
MQGHASNLIAFPMPGVRACRVPIPEFRVTRANLPPSVAAILAREGTPSAVLIVDSRLDDEQAHIAMSMTLVQAVGTTFAWTSTEDVNLARHQFASL